MTLDVGADAEAFVNNPDSANAVANTLASNISVTADQISVTLELIDARRLAGRKLQDQSVLATYAISLSSSEAADAVTGSIRGLLPDQFSTGLNNELQRLGVDAQVQSLQVHEVSIQADLNIDLDDVLDEGADDGVSDHAVRQVLPYYISMVVFTVLAMTFMQ